MSTRRASWLAWSLAAAGLAMLTAGAALVAINSNAVGSNAAMIVLYGSWVVIGALAVSRQPRNLVGWLFLAAGVAAALQIVPGELAVFMYRHGGPVRERDGTGLPLDWARPDRSQNLVCIRLAISELHYALFLIGPRLDLVLLLRPGASWSSLLTRS